MKYIVHGKNQWMIEFKPRFGFDLHLLRHGIFVDFTLVKHLIAKETIEEKDQQSKLLLMRR